MNDTKGCFSTGGWQTKLLMAMLLFSLLFQTGVVAAVASGSRSTSARPLEDIFRDIRTAGNVDRNLPPDQYQQEVFRRQKELNQDNFQSLKPQSAVDWIYKFAMLPWLGVTIAWTLWSWRAYRNLEVFDVAGLRFSPIWAVLAFIIPIANVAFPYFVLTEVWKASGESQHPLGWQAGRNSPVLIVWLIINLAAAIIGFAGVVTIFVSNEAYTVSLTVQSCILVGLASTSLLLVRLFEKRQAARFTAAIDF